MFPKLVKWAFIPLALIFIALLLTGYVLENPTDSLVARLITATNVIKALKEHLGLVFVSMLAATSTGIIFGIILSRPSFYYLGKVIENVVNIGQTVPSLAILALFYTVLGLGFNVAVFALWIYSILPILRNTYAGIKNVTPDVIEAAKGMGMSSWRILTRIELPIAMPIILAGIRTAIVINVGAATLATFIGAGGLGDFIVTGLSVRRDLVVLTGAGLAAITAIFFDYLVGLVEEHLVHW
jgi:osmoprotectant transport system permease protein